MLRTLLTPRWVAALALALAFAVLAVLLGSWQYSRHEDRAAAADRVERFYDAEPVPLEQVVPGSAGAVPDGREWSRVRARGSYLPEEQLLVRNRPHRGVFGYEVLVPLVLDGSPERAVLVDRGWVPNAPDAGTLPDVPPPPGGTVEVVGWLRPGEESLGRDLPAGQLASVDLTGARQRLDHELLDGYVVLEREDTGSASPVPRPEPLEPPRTDLGAHLAYALQWWLTAPVGLVLVLVMARREHRERTGTGSPRPRRTRIWDEEDE